MREQVDRLAKLATDLLDLSRLDAGRLAVASEPIDLGELADDLGASSGPRGTAAHPLDVAREPASWRSATPSASCQIGRILVENALVHTPSGTTVRVSAPSTAAARP